MRSFTIDKLEWHSKTPGNPEPRERMERRFRAILTFLQQEGLTKRVILREGDPITEATEIHSDDLTDRGLALMKSAYHQWLTKVDRGMPPEDLSTLIRALKKL